MVSEKIIGIDLGTSNSQAAVMMGGKPTIIPSAEGATVAGKMFPSVVAFTKDGQLLVGESARRQAISNPNGTVLAAKRKMGTDFKYEVYNKSYTPQQISAFILQKIKKDAEDFLGEPIKKVVITVPAYFNDNQRQATKDAGTIAGLDVVRIINEPTAASLAYGLDKKDEQTVLIFDLGGGTLDVTILEFSNGVFEVKSTSGDTQLGGTDMDVVIMNFLINEFKKQEGMDLNDDNTAMQRLRDAAEKAKIELSNVMQTDINLPYITATNKGPKHLNLTLTRAKLEQLIQPIIDRCKHPVEQALSDAKIDANKITKIILVGGPTRMPCVQKFVSSVFGDNVARGVDPMECVAVGAAIQGAVLAGDVKDLLLLDVTPLTLGIETLGSVFTALIERNTTIPTKKSQIFSTAADNQTAVTVHILQGERQMASDNVSLGQFNLVGVLPAPRGIPQIEVTFDIDANGILNVSAKDLGTNKEQKITISASTKMSKDAINKAVKEAEAHAEEDKKRKEDIETVNQADTLVYATEKTISELGDKITAEQKKKLNDAVKKVKDLLIAKERDTAAIKSATEDLSKIMQEISTAIYQSAAQQQSKQQDTTDDKGKDKPKDDNVVDADFKVDEK